MLGLFVCMFSLFFIWRPNFFKKLTINKKNKTIVNPEMLKEKTSYQQIVLEKVLKWYIYTIIIVYIILLKIKKK